IQAAPAIFDTPATLEKVGQWTDAARREGARLAVFPEAFLGSYPYGLDFGTRIGLRTPEGRELYRTFHEAAIEVPGPETAALGAVAKRHACHLVIGVVERDQGTLYSSALTFGADGTLLARRRKLSPLGVERYVWGRGDGSTLAVAETPIGRIGAVLGSESYMPPLHLALYAQSMNHFRATPVHDSDGWPSSMSTVETEG